MRQQLSPCPEGHSSIVRVQVCGFDLDRRHDFVIPTGVNSYYDAEDWNRRIRWVAARAADKMQVVVRQLHVGSARVPDECKFVPPVVVRDAKSDFVLNQVIR